MTRISFFPLAVLLLLGAASALAQDAATAVSATDAYVRAVPPGQPNSAAFLTLTNASDAAHALVGAESDAAQVVELHSHVMDEGMMKMRRIERIDIPASGTVSLAPGGLHLMLIGLTDQLEPDRQVGLTLVFEDGSRTRLSAPVRKVQPGMSGADKSGKCGAGRCGGGRCGGNK